MGSSWDRPTSTRRWRRRAAAPSSGSCTCGSPCCTACRVTGRARISCPARRAGGPPRPSWAGCAIFRWVLELLAEKGLLKGKTVGIDGTTLEANAAMRSIVRRDTGEGYEEFLRRLAEESGIATPTREQLAKLDRKRAKKGSNDDWVNPHDPEAEITQLKDGRTHLAYKAEHAVDLETGAVVAVTVAGGAAGDTETILETLPQAGEHIAEVACATNNEEVGERVHPEGPIEAVTDKGYHSNDTLTALQQAKVRSYVSEPDRGRRRWQDKPEARQAVYDNRRRSDKTTSATSC